MREKTGKKVRVKVNALAGYIKENVARTARRLKGVEQDPQISGRGDFAVTRNWARAKVMDRQIARTRLKEAFEREYITAEQLNAHWMSSKPRGVQRPWRHFSEEKSTQRGLETSIDHLKWLREIHQGYP